MFLSVLSMAPAPLTPREQLARQHTGASLRAHRERRGYKLGPFATKLGISYSYLSNIEAGRKPLTDVLLARAATLLELDQIAIKIPDADLLDDEQVPA